MQFLNKKIGITLVVLFFVLVSLLYRQQISRFLALDIPSEEAIEPVSTKEDAGEDQRILQEFPTTAEKKEIIESKKPELEGITSGEATKEAKVIGLPTPPYSGRNPGEVRPDPEEVKLFSDSQKNEIYRAIGNHGEAVKKNPQFLDGWIQVGLLKKVIGDYVGARDAWEYAGLIRPKNSVSFANLGELYWKYLKDFPQAEANFKISIKNKPDDISTSISLSELYSYSYKEKKGLADDVLLDGLSVNPGDVNLMKALAVLYEREGNTAKAVEWWQKVLEKEPSNKEVAVTIEALKKQ